MTETPDLPCPKCGSQRTEMIWCDAPATQAAHAKRLLDEWGKEQAEKIWSYTWTGFGSTYHDSAGQERRCSGPFREHFHRGCLRCGYRWITEDVVTG